MGKYLLTILLFTCAKGLTAQTFTEILGRPTDNSVTINALFDQYVEVYFRWGETPGNYTDSTQITTGAVDTPVVADFQSLLANQRYFYQTRYRRTGTTDWFNGKEHMFHTQRAIGSTYRFNLQGDEHLYGYGNDDLFKVCLKNQVTDSADFMISLGDIFGKDAEPNSYTSEDMRELRKYYLPLFNEISPSCPLYICLGNHDAEKSYYLAQNPPNNIGVWSTLWRKFYYPNPYPNTFYSGNTAKEGYGIGYPENYFAWTWGDAQYIVLDAYRYQSDTLERPTRWDWSLGRAQYDWLTTTLEKSTSKFKFVFIHHGGGESRGGAKIADKYEWGGYSNGGTWEFDVMRPGWPKPLHQLMQDNGVDIVFQGHDHVFSYELVDGIVYQTVPMPSDATYAKWSQWASNYIGTTLEGCGHLRITVSPDCATVDYITAYLPEDEDSTHKNGEVAFTYVLDTCSKLDINDLEKTENISVYPNPARNTIEIQMDKALSPGAQILITDGYGREVQRLSVQGSKNLKLDVGRLTPGFYILSILDGDQTYISRVVIN